MSEPFSAVLLAGGRSRRMGQDKAFLRIGASSQLMWERQLELLKSLEPDQLLLSHNSEQEFLVPGGVELVEDLEEDRGPLGGLVSCLRQARNSRLLVLAVDLPYATADFLQSMLVSGEGIVLQETAGGRFEAVVAVYTQDCLAIAEARLRGGELAMQGFVSACVEAGLLKASIVGEEGRSLLKNLNRPEDLPNSP